MKRLLAATAAAAALLTGCGTSGSTGGGIGGIGGSALEEASEECNFFGEIGDGGDALIINGAMPSDFADLACVLMQIDTPESVVASMDSTTSLMGRQSQEADGFTYEWSYHPDSGMNLIITD